MNNTQRCYRCKVNLPVDQFKLKRCGNRMKGCIKCNATIVRWNKNRERKRIPCPSCDKTYLTKAHLARHIKQVHDKIKDFECLSCEYKCSTKGNLNKHIKQVHNKIKDFKCLSCDKTFFTKTHLNIHIKQVHDKIKDIE